MVALIYVKSAKPNRLLNRTKRRFSVSRRSWSRLLFLQTIGSADAGFTVILLTK
jgi:hypothetical protein